MASEPQPYFQWEKERPALNIAFLDTGGPGPAAAQEVDPQYRDFRAAFADEAQSADTVQNDPPINFAGVGTFPPAEIALSWAPDPSNFFAPVSYDIFRDGSFLATVVHPTLAFVDTTVVSDEAFSYRINVMDTAGNVSQFSSPINVAVPNLELWEPPENISFSIQSQTVLRIAWSPPTLPPGTFPIESYNVYRDSVLIGNTGGLTSLFDDTAPYSADSNWQIAVVDDDGNECELSAGDTTFWAGLVEVNHYDETSLVGAAPVTAWNDLFSLANADSVLGDGSVFTRGSQNGLDTLLAGSSGGVQTMMRHDTPGTYGIPAPLSVIAVCRLGAPQDGGDNQLHMLDASSGSSRVILVRRIAQLDMSFRPSSVTGDTPTAFDDDWNVHTLVLQANQDFDSYLNDVFYNSGSTGSTGIVNLVAFFGDTSGNRTLEGEYGEVLYFDYVLTETQRLFWVDYLRDKWDI